MTARIYDLSHYFQQLQAARFRERVETDGYWTRIYREIAERAQRKERARRDYVRRYTDDGPEAA